MTDGIRFNTDWRAWGPGALEAVLWLVLAVNGARLAWLLLVSPTPSETAFMPSAAFVPAAWPDRDPFYPAAGATNDVAPASLAGYTLHGVRRAAGEAGAIIADPDGRQRAFRVGDSLSPGIVLHAVGAAHAVLAANGSRHRLELPQVASTLAAPPPTLPNETVLR